MQSIKKILRAQALVAILVAVGFTLCNWHWGIAALLGSMIAWVGEVYLALRLFYTDKPQSAVQVLARFYQGVFGRFVLSIALLSVVLALSVWTGWAVVAGFGITVLVSGFVMLVRMMR